MPKKTDPVPSALALSEITDEVVGGKAAGLAALHRTGLAVPPGFVILNAQPDLFPPDLAQRYAALGAARVAVRSSALGEDGQQASCAGQYVTLLNVAGEQALQEAITECVNSLHSDAALAYRRERLDDGDSRMCVVVQVMVEPIAAGVLFSADPVSGRHDRLVIDAVAGLGEVLVSGEVTPDHFELDNDNKIVRRDLVGTRPILSDAQIAALARDARTAVAHHGEHLDMEWAIAADGRVYWLQGRPITTLGCDLNAGYTPIGPGEVITRCNVGEMMPGPVCPLTFSTQGRAIEAGMQHMHVCYAGRPAITEEWTQINLFYGHMFINLSGGLESSRAVSLTNAEVMGQTMCGRVIPELVDPGDKKPLPLRWWGSLKFVRYCLAAARIIAEFESRFRHFHIRYREDSLAMQREMEGHFHWLLEADEVHLRSSAYSGVMEGVVQALVAGKNRNTGAEGAAAQQAEAARLLAGASHVESAMMVAQLDAVVDQLAEHSEQARQFRRWSPGAALAWLRGEAAGAVGLGFADFLKHHGHRGYRELCVREKAWADDPEQVVRSIQAALGARLEGSYKPKQVAAVDTSALGPALRWLLPRAHLAIRQREQTKSMLVDATYRLKCGYRHLGRLLEREGKLDDADLVFFMSRRELASFCAQPDPALADLTHMRRRALQFQEKLEFDDIHVGFATPREPTPILAGGADVLVGRPVSRGVVEGLARVALTLEQAAHLQPGEILVSRITDIGWTPYFSLIAGLATDVGSAVSHGAVIAREYGLPAIVNLRHATRVIQTGDRVRLDADKGVLTRLPVQD